MLSLKFTSGPLPHTQCIQIQSFISHVADVKCIQLPPPPPTDYVGAEQFYISLLKSSDTFNLIKQKESDVGNILIPFCIVIVLVYKNNSHNFLTKSLLTWGFLSLKAPCTCTLFTTISKTHFGLGLICDSFRLIRSPITDDKIRELDSYMCHDLKIVHFWLKMRSLSAATQLHH